MSIRLLAAELYRAMKEVEELERKLERPSLPAAERNRLEEQLRRGRAERDRIKGMLEGTKES